MRYFIKYVSNKDCEYVEVDLYAVKKLSTEITRDDCYGLMVAKVTEDAIYFEESIYEC
jgi:hypothetical protein